MDLNLFDNKRNENSFIDKFMEELKSALNNTISEKQNRKETNNELDQYDIYEKKKIFLDNKSRYGNDFAWITDDCGRDRCFFRGHEKYRRKY